ncbi:hypothetical protein [Porphyromonas gulae]|uniref:hypothetical protein n=1 Tax=Porphyromonas gulae TaxID=111105 RepID=UPI003743128C
MRFHFFRNHEPEIDRFWFVILYSCLPSLLSFQCGFLKKLLGARYYASDFPCIFRL